MKRRITGPARLILALLALAICALLPATASAAAKATVLDHDFGAKGIALAPSGIAAKYPWTDSGVQAARSADGTIFVLVHPGSSGEVGGRIIAFTDAGTLDQEFGKGGVEAAPTELDGVAFEARQIAADAAGRLLIVGKMGQEAVVGVVRLLPSGPPDPSFGGLGHVVLKLTPGTSSLLPSSVEATVSVDPSGRLLVVAAPAYERCATGADLIRLAENGEPDQGFGTKGTVHLDSKAQFVFTSPQWVGGEGAFEVVVAAPSFPCAGSSRPPEPQTLMRFDPSGSPDASFGNGGSVGLGDRSPRAIAVDREGRTVVLYNLETALRRVSATGSFEKSYGKGGLVRLRNFPPELSQLALTAGGAALVAGTFRMVMIKGHYYDQNVAVGRVDPNGHVVRGFGEGGVALAHAGKGGEALGEALLLDGEGHALVAGLLTSPRNPKIAHGVGVFGFDLGR